MQKMTDKQTQYLAVEDGRSRAVTPSHHTNMANHTTTAKPLAGRTPMKALKKTALALAVMTSSFLAGPISLSANELPSVKVGKQITLHNPSDAQSYYAGLAAPCGVNCVSTLSNIVEVDNLARGLDYNVDTIFQYVHDTVDTLPTFGVKKGAAGVVLDGNGTAFDQAHLMLELLLVSDAEGGTTYNPKFVIGDISLNGTEFDDLYGITEAKAACYMLANGGIPATVNGSTNCGTLSGNVSAVVMTSAWVQATINSVQYYFDPSIKRHSWKAKADLGNLMQYTRSNFVTKVSNNMTASSMNGTAYVQNVNDTALTNVLNARSTTLQNSINTFFTGKTLDDLIGGKKIISHSGSPLRQTSLPNQVGANHSLTASVPNAYRTVLKLDFHDNIGGLPGVTQIFLKEFYVDDIYGRRLVVEASPDMNVMSLQLKAGGTSIASYSNSAHPTNRSLGTIDLEVDYPYAAEGGLYLDRTQGFGVDYVTSFTIVHGWGEVSESLLSKFSPEKYGQRLVKPIYTWWDDTHELGNFTPQPFAEHVKTQVAATWLAQFSRMMDLNARIGDAVAQHHGSFGVSFSRSHVDVQTPPACTSWCPGNGEGEITAIGDEVIHLSIVSDISVSGRSGSDGLKEEVAQSIAAGAATLEGSVFEQQNDAPATYSTATRMAWANLNDKGDFPGWGTGSSKFFWFPANAGCGASCLTSAQNNMLVRYINGGWSASGSLANTVSAYMAAGYDVVATEHAQLGPGHPLGKLNPTFNTYPMEGMNVGLALIAVKPDTGEIAHIVSDMWGNFKGSGSGATTEEAAEFDPLKAADILNDTFEDRSNLHGVSLATGKLSYSPAADISVGSGGFPQSLDFQRTFNSGGGKSPGLPDGWTHNYDINVSGGSSGQKAMGSRGQPDEAIPSIVAMFIAQDLYKSSEANLHKQLYTILINDWWRQHLANNTATVRIGTQSHEFVRKVDGSFSGPQNADMTLVQTGVRTLNIVPSTYNSVLQYRYGNVGYIFTGSDKSTITFAQRNRLKNGYFGVTLGATIFSTAAYYPATNWSFPSGQSLTFAYDNAAQSGFYDAGQSPKLQSVSNNFGRSLNFTWGTYQNLELITAVSDTTGRSASFAYGRSGTTQPTSTWNYAENTSPDGTATYYGDRGLIISSVTMPDATVFNYAYTGNVGAWPYPLLDKIYGPHDTLNAMFDVDYLSRDSVASYKDAEAVLGTRNAFDFIVAEGFRGERVDPLGNSYNVYYGQHDGTTDYGTFMDEMGATVRTEFDDLGRVTRRIYAEGNRQEFDYDNLNNVTAMRRISKDGSATRTASATYANASFPTKPTSVTDFMGGTTTLAYDASGNLTSAVRPTVLDGVTGTNKAPTYSFAYNASGQPFRTIDAMGMVTVIDYDTSGNATKTATNCGTTSATTTASCLGSDQIITSATYSSAGDALTTTDPNGNISSSLYDAMRRPTRSTDALGNYSIITLDALGRDTKTEAFNPAGVLQQSSEKTYTATGQVATTKDPEGWVTTTFYDALDRPEITQDAMLRQTKTVYRADGKVTKLIRAYGTAIAQDYQSYSYTVGGQVASVKDAGRNVTTYTYDGFDRLVRTDYPSNAACTQLGDNGSCLAADNLPDLSDYEAFFYDAGGNMKGKHTRNGDSIRFAYDALNRQTRKFVTLGRAPQASMETLWNGCNMTLANSTEVCTTYDLGDKVKEIKQAVDAATPQIVTNSYNSAGRLTQSAMNYGTGHALGTKATTYEYDAAGNRTKVTYPHGWVALDYSYDALNRLGTITNASTGTPYASYAYDALSRRTSLTRANGKVTSYTYHDDNMPESMTHAGLATGGGALTWDFAFDKANQMTGRTVSDDFFQWKPEYNSTEDYSRNGLNQYTTVATNPYKYDGNGSLTDTHDGTVDDGWAYIYDVENRLTSATEKSTGKITTYDYDPMGRMSSKAVGGVDVEYYAYDGVEPIVDMKPDNKRMRMYLNGAGVDERLVSWNYDAAGAYLDTRYIYTDHQGSVISDGVDTFRYDEFGVPDAASEGGYPFKYTGRRYDADTGLYYYRARFYKADLGRFLQTDPIGYEDQMNMYTYVANSPMGATDPLGLFRMASRIKDNNTTAPSGVVETARGEGGKKLPPPRGATDRAHSRKLINNRNGASDSQRDADLKILTAKAQGDALVEAANIVAFGSAAIILLPVLELTLPVILDNAILSQAVTGGGIGLGTSIATDASLEETIINTTIGAFTGGKVGAIGQLGKSFGVAAAKAVVRVEGAVIAHVITRQVNGEQ